MIEIQRVVERLCESPAIGCEKIARLSISMTIAVTQGWNRNLSYSLRMSVTY